MTVPLPLFANLDDNMIGSLKGPNCQGRNVIEADREAHRQCKALRRKGERERETNEGERGANRDR